MKYHNNNNQLIEEIMKYHNNNNQLIEEKKEKGDQLKILLFSENGN